MQEIKKIRLTKKEMLSFSLFFLFIYLLGFQTGSVIPEQNYETVFKYGVLLEKENSKLRRKLKSCN